MGSGELARNGVASAKGSRGWQRSSSTIDSSLSTEGIKPETVGAIAKRIVFRHGLSPGGMGRRGPISFNPWSKPAEMDDINLVHKKSRFRDGVLFGNFQ